MPYIENEKRIPLDKLTSGFMFDSLSEGELNYLFTRILTLWINPIKYARFNAAIGVLECAKQELYRRKVVPYEDKKRDENGEVY